MERREPIALRRAVEVTLVPSGERHVLPEGAWVVPQQVLGGHYTVMTDRGGLARIADADADALGEAYAEQARRAAEAEKAKVADAADRPFDEQQVWEALKKVFDPEIPASIVDLGLVYECRAEPLSAGGHRVAIRMTLTAPGCGVAPLILDDVRDRVAKVPGVSEVDVELVFEPPWTPARMSDAARLQLGMW
ncbi:MAG TPA: putative Fe-S cluster assembly protein SufT [Anaeromyxobacteraceae bacterium]|nr:putative Fe-S cluster assembly protein SufT [Anaeromyxobacteraceae bacterium]